MSTNQLILQTGYVLTSPDFTYRIEKVLGSGGFGITYLATAAIKVGNVTTEARFAIKEHFMSDDCERDPKTSRVVYSNPAKERVENSRKDFIAEARRLQKVGIDHPNIVKVNEVFEANNTAYYVMEYIDGESLRSYVKRKRALGEEEMITIMNPIIEAVRYLHTNRMTHLDIKPDNIMLAKNYDGTMRPVLIDFGLSKHYDKNGRPTSTVNTLGCSDGYAPIEQYAGITTFSPSADIYAIGATMWFCLTGIDPQRSTDLADGELSKSLPSGISPRMRDVVRQCTRRDRTDRLMSVLSADDVPQPVMYGGPMPEDFGKGKRRTKVIDSGKQTSQRWWVIVAAVAAGVVVLGVALFFILKGCDRPRDTQEDMENEDMELVAGADALAIGKAFRDSIAAYPEARELNGGTIILTEKAGHGATPSDNDYVRINYRLTLPDGTVIDDTEGTPVDMPVSGLIDGFVEGLHHMRAGGTYYLAIPPSQGYGSQETSGIPANSTLWFQVELIDVISNSGTQGSDGNASAGASQSEQSGSQTQTQTASTSGTLSLGYGTWTGGIRNGKPDGSGRLTFTSVHRVDRSTSYEALSGDYFIATYDNGNLISGKLYNSDGELLKTIVP